MRVLFIADPGPRDTPRGQHYAAGEIHELTPDQAYKWITVLGIAVAAPEVIRAAAASAAETPPAETPPAETPPAPDETPPDETPAAHLLAETDPSPGPRPDPLEIPVSTAAPRPGRP